MSAVKLIFEFDSAEQAADFLNSRVVHSEAAPLAPSVAQDTPAAKPSRGRPRKQAETPAAPAPTPEVTPEVAPEPTPQPEPEAQKAETATEPKAVTIDDARQALRDLFNAKGATLASELLKEFGAIRVSDVKPEDYAKFVAKAAKLLGK
jgi:hypothetical protein